MKQHAPATERNREAIRHVLEAVLPPTGLVLEVASGSGQHAVAFARNFPGLLWQPSDLDPQARTSIQAWSDEAGLGNLLEPLNLDAAHGAWPIERADAILAINLLHISPWSTTLGLMRGAARRLAPGGVLYVYGPFKEEGRHTAPSNATFEHWLHTLSAEYGVRDREAVEEAALAAGLQVEARVAMPANNLSLVFRR